ncbi:hypothetical protein BC835DRAFT_245402 [Cytidiella melzeri]|nr:hypothetical protein BC835DRAFT_245402 [Cytidiella melzeri]
MRSAVILIGLQCRPYLRLFLWKDESSCWQICGFDPTMQMLALGVLIPVPMYYERNRRSSLKRQSLRGCKCRLPSCTTEIIRRLVVLSWEAVTLPWDLSSASFVHLAQSSIPHGHPFRKTLKALMLVDYQFVRFNIISIFVSDCKRNCATACTALPCRPMQSRLPVHNPHLRHLLVRGALP